LGFLVFDNFRFATPSTAVIGLPSSGARNYGSHAVLAVGYDSRGLLVVNSWGTSWGNQGFAWLTPSFVQKYVYEAWVSQDFNNSFRKNISDTILPVLLQTYP